MIEIPSAVCLEVFHVVCLNKFVQQQFEAFLIVYGEEFNKLHGHHFLITEHAELQPHLAQKAKEYAINTKIYEFVHDVNEQFPPQYPHLATLDELTVFPLKVYGGYVQQRFLYNDKQNKYFYTRSVTKSNNKKLP